MRARVQPFVLSAQVTRWPQSSANSGLPPILLRGIQPAQYVDNIPGSPVYRELYRIVTRNKKKRLYDSTFCQYHARTQKIAWAAIAFYSLRPNPETTRCRVLPEAERASGQAPLRRADGRTDRFLRHRTANATSQRGYKTFKENGSRFASGRLPTSATPAAVVGFGFAG